MWHLILYKDVFVKNPRVSRPHREQLLQGKQLGDKSIPRTQVQQGHTLPMQAFPGNTQHRSRAGMGTVTWASLETCKKE